MTPVHFEIPEIESLAGLFPAYDFDCLIAKGGMGAVFKARQRSLDRDVAIKVLPRELGEDPVFRDSFRAEARAMARLAHPNLIRVYDSGELDGLLFIVMEFVPGKSLHHSAHGRAIDPQQAVEIIMAACEGLSHAHENGIIHRDIKPANILLTPKREPKIGDFGLARCTRSGADGPAMGTPGYMAPEVIKKPGTGTPQSDVFALGVVLKEMLTGVPAGSERSEKAVVPDLTLAGICRKATHPDPAFRFSNADAFREGLAKWQAAGVRKPLSVGHPVPDRPKPVLVPSTPPSGARMLIRNCAVIACLLAAIHLTWGVYQTKKSELARLQQEEASKPRVIVVKAAPKKDAPRELSIRSFQAESTALVRRDR